MEVLTAASSRLERLPSAEITNRWSIVNSFILTTEGDGSPACFRSSISTSNGHALFFALVIMAMTLCPMTLLNSDADDNTSAGLCFVVARSVNGKGTETTERA